MRSVKTRAPGRPVRERLSRRRDGVRAGVRAGRCATALGLSLWALLAGTAVAQDTAALDADDHFQVGVGAELTSHNTMGLRDEVLLGPSVTHRWGWLGLGGRVMLGPAAVVDYLRSDDSELETYRVLLGLHLRAALRLGGVEWTYGIGAHSEARLSDHFWLFYVTPLELGALIWEQGSWRVRALAGLRLAMGGELINIFLLDPNGFDNAEARDELEREKDDIVSPFFGVVFARRID
jgi:hypothetical protein